MSPELYSITTIDKQVLKLILIPLVGTDVIAVLRGPLMRKEAGVSRENPRV